MRRPRSAPGRRTGRGRRAPDPAPATAAPRAAAAPRRAALQDACRSAGRVPATTDDAHARRAGSAPALGGAAVRGAVPIGRAGPGGMRLASRGGRGGRPGGPFTGVVRAGRGLVPAPVPPAILALRFARCGLRPRLALPGGAGSAVTLSAPVLRVAIA